MTSRQKIELLVINVHDTFTKRRGYEREGPMFSKLVVRSGRYEDEARGVRVFGRRATVTEISSCRSYQDYWCEPCVVPVKRVWVGEGNEVDG